MRRVRIGVFGMIIVLGVLITQVLFIVDEHAQAYEHDPRFYVFLRTLEAYDDILTPETLLVLPGDADMFRLLSRLPSTVKPMQGQ